jgi:hypothetical protein
MADGSCQFLITITNGAPPTVQQDPTQGPYERAEDALIGVQNNSSQPLTLLPISAPGVFGFEADGICNPGTPPIAPGCVPAPGAPPGTVCGPQNGSCSFPRPACQPAGYTEPGSPPGTTQNGYEGPNMWFANVSADMGTGTVTFCTPVPPGGSSYFALESPPSLSSITIGQPNTPGPPPRPVPAPVAPPRPPDTPPPGTPPRPPLTPPRPTPPGSLPPAPAPQPGTAPPGTAPPGTTPPGTTPPAATPPAFGRNGVIGIPSNRRCLSRRSFRIRIRRKPGLTYSQASVAVNGRRVGVLRGRRLISGVNLRGLPAGRFTVRIAVLTTDGRAITGTRRYRTCTKRIPSKGPPRL